jgi:hypothetical protein
MADRAEVRAVRDAIRSLSPSDAGEPSNETLGQFLQRAGGDPKKAAVLFFRSAAVPGSSSKRQRTGNDGSSTDKVFLVIHDREPQDSGSDYNHSNFLHNRQDTEVVSVHKSRELAVRAAQEYVLDNFDGEIDQLGIDADDEDEVNEHFDGYDWQGEGFYRREECDANDPNDRVHIIEMALSE